ncbi:MAG: efflux RND transporter periplasmic adaptor subunit [Thermotogaceae bacterium]|nr:efflux RND transporter periplasmic adaptor subunit [Thermotogaceae bacterium]
MKRWMWFAGALVSLVVIGTAFYLGYRKNAEKTAIPVTVPQTTAVDRGNVAFTVTGPGVSVDNGETVLESMINGRIENLAVRPGDHVSAGQVLATLGPQVEFENAVNTAQAQVQDVQQQLNGVSPELLLSQAQLTQAQAEQDYQMANNLRLNPNSQRGSEAACEAATAEFHLAEQAFTDAENAYNDVSNLPVEDSLRNNALSVLAAARHRKDLATWNLDYLQGKPSADEVTASNAKADAAKATLDQANRDLALAQNGQSPDLLNARAALETARATLAQAQADLSNLAVKAPFDGVILEVSAQTGQSVTNGLSLMSISNLKNQEVLVTVVEEDLNLVHAGQPVDLFFDALPDTTLSGKITRVVPKRSEEDKAVYPVYISVNQFPDNLVPGMTVDATITINERTGVLRLPRTVVRSVGTDQAEVEVWTGSVIEKRTIQVGLHGDSYVEILSGLDEGDQVVAQ